MRRGISDPSLRRQASSACCPPRAERSALAIDWRRWAAALLSLALLPLALIALGCREEKTATDPIILQLNWRADAQHGGFFAALALGEYAKEGLNVKIVEGGPGSPVIPKLVMGRVDFAIANADQILQAREQEADIVAVFAPLQHTPRCIMVHAESGITRFDQLTGIRLAMNEGRTFAMFLRHHLSLDNVQVVPYTGSISPFLADPDYAQQAYVFSEPLLARREGAQPHCLMLSDLGFDPYTSSVAVRRELLETDPDRVRRFVRASQRGWESYLQSPEIANEAIRKINPDMDMETLAASVDELRKLCSSDGATSEDFGTMSSARWEQLAKQMHEIGAIADQPERAAAMAWSNLPLSSTEN